MTTLAALQTERERLRAEASRATYQAELARTVESIGVRVSVRHARARVQEALATLPGRLAAAVEGETEEARVHYLLSDAAIDWLRELSEAVQADEHVEPLVGEALARGLRPRELLTVSQWADKHRFMASGTNAPGQWRTDRTPYLREIMDSLSEHSPVKEVTFQKASGVGGTEVLYNWIGYVMHHLRNKDMLLVVPTLELRNRSLNPRLRKTFQETAVLGELVSSGRRDRTNRDDVIEYGAGARIIKAGANSPDSMRSEHLPYVAKDETDAYPWDLGGEGDPNTLIANRQTTFSRWKTYNVSTPTLKDESHIEAEHRLGDGRRYHVPCPHCGHLHTLEWEHFNYRLAAGADHDDPTAEIASAWMACPECGAVIEEADKPRMLAEESGARWIPQRPHIKHHRSYHLNSLYAPIGIGRRWLEIAAQWRKAQNDTSRLKAFINTRLGQTWEEEGEGIEGVPLIGRLETYRASALPIRLITAGVDVQQDRLEATVAGWGEGEECWVLDHIILSGDTFTEEPWEQLEPALRELGVTAAALDSNYRTDMCRAYCRLRGWIIPTRGTPGPGRPILEDERRRRQRLRYRRKKGMPLEPIGVDEAKSLVYRRLRSQRAGPGFVHFPDLPAFDDEYFAQLAAEKLVRRARRGRIVYEWVQTRPRNEALDCLILALVAARLNGRRLDAPPAARPGEPAAARGRAGRSRKGSQGEGFGRDEWNL